jgi:hypothetical protein
VQDEELHNLRSSQITVAWSHQRGREFWACSTHGGRRKRIQNLTRKIWETEITWDT